MLYTHKNARGAQVRDMDSKTMIDRVLEVNTRAGWVKVGHNPPRLDAQGRIAGERIRFQSIHVIQGSEPRPVLFHCYGRFASNPTPAPEAVRQYDSGAAGSQAAA